MMNKFGRPKREIPRNLSMTIRLTAEEAERIKKCAEILRVTRTDAVNKAVSLLWKKLEGLDNL